MSPIIAKEKKKTNSSHVLCKPGSLVFLDTQFGPTRGRSGKCTPMPAARSTDDLKFALSGMGRDVSSLNNPSFSIHPEISSHLAFDCKLIKPLK